MVYVLARLQYAWLHRSIFRGLNHIEQNHLLIRVSDCPRSVLYPVKSADEKFIVDLKSDFDGQGQEGDFALPFDFDGSGRRGGATERLRARGLEVLLAREPLPERSSSKKALAISFVTRRHPTL